MIAVHRESNSRGRARTIVCRAPCAHGAMPVHPHRIPRHERLRRFQRRDRKAHSFPYAQMNTPDSSPWRQNKPKTPKKPPEITAPFAALRPAGIAGERDGDFLAPRIRGAFICQAVWPRRACPDAPDPSLFLCDRTRRDRALCSQFDLTLIPDIFGKCVEMLTIQHTDT